MGIFDDSVAGLAFRDSWTEDNGMLQAQESGMVDVKTTMAGVERGAPHMAASQSLSGLDCEPNTPKLQMGKAVAGQSGARLNERHWLAVEAEILDRFLEAVKIHCTAIRGWGHFLVGLSCISILTSPSFLSTPSSLSYSILSPSSLFISSHPPK